MNGPLIGAFRDVSPFLRATATVVILAFGGLVLPLTHKSAISAPRKCQAKARCAANGDPLASAATRAWRFRGAPFG